MRGPTQVDITGLTFNRLTAVSFSHRTNSAGNYWKFQCECGNSTTARKSHVINGRLKSCGCLAKEKSAIRSISRMRSWQAVAEDSVVAC